MFENVVIQLITLFCYVSFIFFAFCDGFKLHVARKLIWAVCFLILCLWSYRIKAEFDIPVVISYSSLAALALCRLDKRFKENVKNES